MGKRQPYKHIKSPEVHFHGCTIGTQYVNSQIEAVYQYKEAAKDPFVATVPVKFAPLQKEALQIVASENGLDVSELVRHATDRLMTEIKENLQRKQAE